MAMQCGLFDSTQVDVNAWGMPVGNKAVSAEFFARYFSAFVGSGVYGSGEEFCVKAHDARTLKVCKGEAFIEGYYCFDDEDGYLPLDSAYDEDTYLTVLLRLDRTVGQMSIIWLKHRGAEPVRNESYYDLVLARITIPKGTTSSDQITIQDTRQDGEICGRVRMKADSDVVAWKHAMRLTLTGAVTGNVTFDGSKDVKMIVAGVNASSVTNGTLSVSHGGTGASDAQQALENLGAAAKSHTTNPTDIENGVLGAGVVASDGMDGESRLRNVRLAKSLSGVSEPDGTIVLVYGAQNRGIYLSLSGQLLPIALWNE